MIDHIYILPEPKGIDEDREAHFTVGERDMPSEIESLNAFSETLAGTISDYFNDTDLFDPFAPDKQIDDVYLYFIFNYLKVLQDYIHTEVTKNPDARFIILHFDFFYGHFAKVVKEENIKKINVALDLIYSVFNYFDKNEAISKPGPFENAEDMVEYYRALKTLYYGDPTLYLEVIGKYL